MKKNIILICGMFLAAVLFFSSAMLYAPFRDSTPRFDNTGEFAVFYDAGLPGDAAVMMNGGIMPNMPGAVFYTKNGSVYHLSHECSYLSKSNEIIQGSPENAAATGITRVCSRCSASLESSQAE
jgi:hypothetical protein